MKMLVVIMMLLGSGSAFAAVSKCEAKARKIAIAIERMTNEAIDAEEKISVRSNSSAVNSYEVELKFSDRSKSYYRVTFNGHSGACWGISEVKALQP